MNEAVSTERTTLPVWPFALVLSVPLATWLLSTDSLRWHVMHSIPPGQYLYLASKLAGLMAISVMGFQIAYGILGAPARRALGVERGVMFHRGVGLVVLGAAFAHGVLFVSGVSVRGQHIAWNYIVPSFSSGYYRWMVSIGIVSLVLLTVVVVAGLARRRGPSLWHQVHRLSLVVGALVAWHSLAIGTESRMGAMPYLYGMLAAAIAAAIGLRLKFANLEAQRLDSPKQLGSGER